MIQEHLTSMNQYNRHQFLIEFSYLGHRLFGLQPQKDVTTAGGELKTLIERAAGRSPKALCFAARTDKGVHALHSIATCFFRPPFDGKLFSENLKQQKHPDVFVQNVREVPKKVHARAISVGKHYRYVIEDGCNMATPLGHFAEKTCTHLASLNPFAWQIAPRLNICQLRKASKLLLGSHDFSSFRASGCSAGTNVKTIWSINVFGPIILENNRRQFHIDIVGDAFFA